MIRLRVLIIALVLMVASSCVGKADRKKLVGEMHGEPQQELNSDHSQVTDDNDHHSIPRKYYGQPGSGQISVTDDNDHRYIPRKDFGKHPGNEGNLI